jgi:transcriptional regulator with XRE-family HTH domain
VTTKTLPVELYEYARVPQTRSFGALAGAAASALFVLAPITSPPVSTPSVARTGAGAVPDWTQQTFLRTDLNLLPDLPDWQFVSDETTTDPDQSSSQVRSTAAQVIRVHEVSGLTWEQLARLLGVSRRTLHSWASGARVASGNLERLSTVAAFIEPRIANSPEENRVWLVSPRGAGPSRFDELRRSWTKGNIMEDGLGVRERLGLLTE